MILNLTNYLNVFINKLKPYRKQQIWLLAIVTLYGLFGFFLAPKLLKSNLIDQLKNNYQTVLSIKAIEINPFALSIKVINFELKDPKNELIARADEVFINFQLSSIFRLTWTFDEFRMSAPELFLKRDASGQLNINHLLKAQSKSNNNASSEQNSTSLIPLLLFTFLIEDGVVNWQDDFSAKPLKTSFGPINIQVTELNTLKNKTAQQTVHITTQSSGTINWTGMLQLNPLKSKAHASIKGSHFPLISSYVSHQMGFDIIKGTADIEFDYDVNTSESGTINVEVENVNLGFNDLLINTFSNINALEHGREILSIPTLKLTNGSLDWPAQTVSIDAIEISDSKVSFQRGNSEFSHLMKQSTSKSEHKNTDHKKWQFNLGQFAINDLQLDFNDSTVKPEANINLTAVNLIVEDISNQLNTKFPVTLSLLSRDGGSIQTKGELVVIPKLIYNFDLNVTDLALAMSQSYIRQFIDMEINSGVLNINGHINNFLDDPLLFKGDLSVNDLNLSEQKQGSYLGSMERLWAEKITLSISNNLLDIYQLHINKPVGDLVIDNNGILNVAKLKKEGITELDKDSVTKQEQNFKSEPVPTTMAIKIGKVTVSNALMNFTDHSLPIPFSSKIVALKGSLSAISSLSKQPSTVTLEGKVDEFGFVRVTGSLTPLNPNDNTDLEVSFQNIFVPKFTAYSIPFAGKEISSGSLDLNLQYKVTANQLVSENQIILKEFELGNNVDHPDALSLPLGLAIALLKDIDGNIDIVLPVKGDISSPEFSYGSVIGTALSNLFIKIVASPFTLLANLVGIESNELEHFSFIPGRSDLTPPEINKALKLAEALSLRPELVLNIAGVVNIELDTMALKAQQLESIIESRVMATGEAAKKSDSYSQLKLILMEKLFLEQNSVSDPAVELKTLRANFTTQSILTDAEPASSVLDELAYQSALRNQLINLQTLPQDALSQLAAERVKNTELQILRVTKALQTQILIGPTVSTSDNSELQIKMKTQLSAKKVK